MRSTLIAFFVAAIFSGCATNTPSRIGSTTFATQIVYELHLGIENRVGVPVTISVAIDGKVVYQAVVDYSDIVLSEFNEVGKCVLSEGVHSFSIRDLTSDTRDEFEAKIEEKWDLDILLERHAIRKWFLEHGRPIF